MQVTVRQLIEASEKNGWKWARADREKRAEREGFETDPNSATFSCVVGQGLINLHNNDGQILYRFPTPNSHSTGIDVLDLAFESIYRYNDEEATSYADAVRFMKEALHPFMDEVIDI